MAFPTKALVIAFVVGSAAQIAMVVAGHYNADIAALFAAGGMGISLLAGVLFSMLAKPLSMQHALLGGAIAGGACAFDGILVSHLLGDVPASLLVLGTLSSTVTGLIGGWLGRMFGTRAATA